MKKTTWLIIFLFVLLAHLIAIYFDNETLKFISKPLLVPVLVVYLWIQTKQGNSNLRGWVSLGLFFSWLGDIFLMFEQKKPVFFLLGLSSFLLAQLSYIIFFNRIRMREYIRGNPWFLLLVVIYYAILISVLSPFLGDMKIPVRVYGVVLSFMLLLATHTLFSKNKKAGWWMMIGAVLFVTSDSLLAFDKFYATFNYAGLIIMVTYGLAQLFITEGAVKYINSEKPG
ncbi:MAG TPA: lysoplasmalogenase [Chitinophagaceae bacterium]|nr:lysoplasmalogenase [Chitinophagaceae bacterium]